MFECDKQTIAISFLISSFIETKQQTYVLYNDIKRKCNNLKQSRRIHNKKAGILTPQHPKTKRRKQVSNQCTSHIPHGKRKGRNKKMKWGDMGHGTWTVKLINATCHSSTYTGDERTVKLQDTVASPRTISMAATRNNAKYEISLATQYGDGLVIWCLCMFLLCLLFLDWHGHILL